LWIIPVARRHASGDALNLR